MRLAVQLYTLRDVDDSLLETINRLADTRYDGVQVAGLRGEDPTDLVRAIEDAGLGVADAHVGLEDLEDNYEETVDAYGALGCDRLVVSAYEQEAFGTAEEAREAGEHLADLADRVADDGFELHYHNHTFEFTDLGDETAFEVFARAAEGVGLEIDTGLANHGGADPVALLERYGDRVDLVHLTDSDPEVWERRHADIGTGTVDVEACVDAARDAGAEWIIFEHGLTDDPLASVAGAEDALAPLLD